MTSKKMTLSNPDQQWLLQRLLQALVFEFHGTKGESSWRKKPACGKKAKDPKELGMFSLGILFFKSRLNDP